MSETVIVRPLVLLVAALLTLTASLASARIAMHSGALLDAPNERSSHDHAVSRAGGIAMTVGYFFGMFVLAVFAGGAEVSLIVLKFLLLGIAALAVGVADDRLTLRPAVKFVGQLALALAFIALVGPLRVAPLPFLGETPLGFSGALLTALWIVGFVNVFNFMDGVNGIAGGAAVIGLSAFAGMAAFGGAPAAAMIAGVTAIAAAGFLPANVLRGRLFMGDGGSHFLAFMIAGLAVYAANETGGNVSVLIMPAVFLPFILDVAFTLGHRLARGQNILSGHREHVYQLVLRSGATHGTVAALYGGATAVCAAAAIVMLAAPPSMQWLALIAPGAVGLVIGLRVYGRARRAGLLAPA